MFTTLDDITQMHGITFTEIHITYTDTIITIFNEKWDKTSIDLESNLDPDVANILALYHKHITKNYKEMERYYKLAIDKGHLIAMYNLAYYYQFDTNNYVDMEIYYKMAIDKGYMNAMNGLGYYHDTITNNYDDMIQYYTMAIEKGSVQSMYNLGYYYDTVINNYDKAKQYYQMAIDKGDDTAMYRVAIHHYNSGDYYKAIEYYCMYMKATADKKVEFYKYNLDVYCNLYPEYQYKFTSTNEIQDFVNRVSLPNSNNLLSECQICLETKPTINWPCHKSHVICYSCYPHIRRDGKCHICRADIWSTV